MNDVSHFAIKQKRAARFELLPGDKRFIDGIKSQTYLLNPHEESRSCLPKSFGLESLFNDNVELRSRIAELEAERAARLDMEQANDARTRAVFDVNRQVAIQYIAEQQRLKLAMLSFREGAARQLLITQHSEWFAFDVGVEFAKTMQQLLMQAMLRDLAVREGLRDIRMEMARLSSSIT